MIHRHESHSQCRLTRIVVRNNENEWTMDEWNAHIHWVYKQNDNLIVIKHLMNNRVEKWTNESNQRTSERTHEWGSKWMNQSNKETKKQECTAKVWIDRCLKPSAGCIESTRLHQLGLAASSHVHMMVSQQKPEFNSTIIFFESNQCCVGHSKWSVNHISTTSSYDMKLADAYRNDRKPECLFFIIDRSHLRSLTPLPFFVTIKLYWAHKTTSSESIIQNNILW
jgi:hypothetical protein